MIAIIGAGGHSKCVYECFHLQGQKVIGFFDDNRDKTGMAVIDGVEVLGVSEDVLKYSDVNELFIAIGDNRKRVEMCAYFKKKGYRLPNAIHILAYKSKFATIGEGNFIMGPAVINPDAKVGNYCIINTSATVGHDCVIEDGVQIGPGVNLAGGSKLGEGVFIGIGAKIAVGVTIGPWTVVGAGSVVLDDLPAGTFCTGVPAMVIKDISANRK